MMITLEMIKKLGYGNTITYKGEEAIEAVKQNSHNLAHVHEQTPEICLEAVKKNGNALKYVKEQTPEICLEAVKQDSFALRYVKEQTPEICLEAVKQDSFALRYVNPDVFLEEALELSVADIEKLLGKKVKIVKG